MAIFYGLPGFADSITGGTSADSVFGYSGNDTISAGTGNDTIDGGAGDDNMTGGAGSDVYYVDSATDTVTEAADEGTDRIIVTANVSATLAANVEYGYIDRDAGNADLTGNTLNNRLYGNDEGNNVLDGGDGRDTMWGG